MSYPLPDEIFGFHAQQSCEKLFKALIAAHGVAYPPTHQLPQLLKLLSACHETIPDLPYDPLRLMPYAVRFRYDTGANIPESDRELIRQSLAQLSGHIVARILLVESPLNP